MVRGLAGDRSRFNFRCPHHSPPTTERPRAFPIIFYGDNNYVLTKDNTVAKMKKATDLFNDRPVARGIII